MTAQGFQAVARVSRELAPWLTKYTPREPNSTVSTIGQTVTSNIRCGLRRST